MNGLELTAIDLGLRGATSGVFLLIILATLLRRATSRQALLGMAMSAGGVFYAIATAPFFPKVSWWWVLPILSAQPAMFWLWARAAFDDDFVLRRWHGSLWLAVVAFGFALTLGWFYWPDLASAGGRGLALHEEDPAESEANLGSAPACAPPAPGHARGQLSVSSRESLGRKPFRCEYGPGL